MAKDPFGRNFKDVRADRHDAIAASVQIIVKNAKTAQDAKTEKLRKLREARDASAGSQAKPASKPKTKRSIPVDKLNAENDT
jgi:hypothetical protein